MAKQRCFIICRRSVPLLIVMGVVAGCGRSDRLPTARVTGTVTLDGKPLQSGSVIFEPVDGRRLAKGSIRSDGSFVLGTYRQGDGAVPGRHRVAVIAIGELPADSRRDPLNPPSGPSLIPVFYSDSSKSGLTFEVKPDGPNVYNAALSSSAKPAQP